MDDFDKIMQLIASKSGYKYIHPSEFLDLISFQQYDVTISDHRIGDPGGFCLAWSFWFLEYYLLNPDEELKELANNAITHVINSDTTFQEFIRSYANKLANWQLNFYKTIKYSAKKFFSYNQTEIDQNELSNLIYTHLK